MNLSALTGPALLSTLAQMERAGQIIPICCDGGDEHLHQAFIAAAKAATGAQAGASGEAADKAARIASALRDVRNRIPDISDDTARLIVSLRPLDLIANPLIDPATGQQKSGIHAAVFRQQTMGAARAEVLGLVTRKNPGLAYEEAWTRATHLAPELFSKTQ